MKHLWNQSLEAVKEEEDGDDSAKPKAESPDFDDVDDFPDSNPAAATSVDPFSGDELNDSDLPDLDSDEEEIVKAVAAEQQRREQGRKTTGFQNLPKNQSSNMNNKDFLTLLLFLRSAW